jgi:GT2 family glycosyltransferase
VSEPVPAPEAGAEFSPAWMMEVELTEPLPTVRCKGQYRRAWVLGRLYTEPVGTCVVPLDEAGLTPDQLGTLLWRALREPVAERFAAAGLAPPSSLTGEGLPAEELRAEGLPAEEPRAEEPRAEELRAGPAAWPFLRRRREVLDTAPFISVVVCTRDRADLLKACLRHLSLQEYPRFEVVVVDNNAPASDAVLALVEDQKSAATYRYVVEPRAGLSWARNAGTAAASAGIIAFLDDDAEPDTQWLTGVAYGFARDDDIGCVTGMTLPARLDTPAQELFEQLGGHGNGRGFAPAVFSRHGPQNPLFPLPAFGVGANMAFRRAALTRIGGFDVALGTGTPARASEDTLALTQVLLAGYRIAYEPAALIRHHHRRDMDSLASQLHGYGVGLTAYYAALLRRQPSVLPALLRLALPAARYVREAKVTRAAAQDVPARLKHLQHRGMLTGPLAYVKSVRQQARVAGPSEPGR